MGQGWVQMALLDNAVTAPADELARHQQQSWPAQAAHVARCSDFYQNLWAGKAPPEDLRDLPELPLSDKAMLRISQAEHPPFGNYLAARKDQASRLHRTSGTTGQAMNLALMSARLRHHRDRRRAGTAAAGLGAEHDGGALPQLPDVDGRADRSPDAGAHGRDRRAVRRRHRPSLLISTIIETGITAISCTPSYPAVLERVIAERFPDLKPRDLGLKLGLFGGERGIDDPALRKRLIRDLGACSRATRTMGFRTSSATSRPNASMTRALHYVAHDVLYVELIDPDSGEPDRGRRPETRVNWC
jgi:phenylacetate-CoA ligase